MHQLRLLQLFLYFNFALASSFYDNPEQDPLPPGLESDQELRRKWDFEVFASLVHLPAFVISISNFVVNSEFSDTVGLFWNLNLRTLEARQLPERKGRSV